MNPSIGVITCPLCEREATVHREARGRLRSLYVRCYEPDGLTARCGTVQARGPDAQGIIWRNMRPLTVDEQDRAAADVAYHAAEQATETVRRARRSRSKAQ